MAMASHKCLKLQYPYLLLICMIACGMVYNCAGVPLSTRSQWIVDDATGERVKLACVNWVAHLQPMLAEGLDKQPLSVIVATISAWGFNCVRLTWATQMFTNATLANAKVRDTFTILKLRNAIDGIEANNPEFMDMTTVEALRAVAAELGRQGVMVVMDNQMSNPGWCCSETDGNGFWGDSNFNVEDWRRGLTAVATEFRDNPYVVGMSLRNELRGKRQNVNDWYKYMQSGAEAIHAANADLLVIHGGLSYAQNLQFLKSRPLKESSGLLHRKVVYEMHRYAFTNGDSYTKSDVNKKCAAVLAQINGDAGFLTAPGRSYTGPLFVSEFGLNIQKWGSAAGDVRFMACLSAFLAGGDLDWAIWALQGSYYLRQGTVDLDETFGLFDHNWTAPRNAAFLRRLTTLQLPLVATPDPTSAFKLFHPASGLCVNAADDNSVSLDTCDETQATWSYEDGRILLDDGVGGIGVRHDDGAAALVEAGGADGWNTSLSAVGMQFASKDSQNGGFVCLDGSSPPAVSIKPCVCLDSDGCSGSPDPTAQWFKLVPATSDSALVHKTVHHLVM